MRFFVCPALLDWTLLLVTFAVSYGAGARGMTLRDLAWLGGGFQAAYMLSSLGCGFLLSRRNALPILLTSAIGGILTGLACLAFSQFGPLLAGMLVLGVCYGFAFNSFQAFMRGEAPPGGLARATALYTVAWSGGCGLGLLTSGSLYAMGVWALGGLMVLLGTAMVATLLLHQARPHHEPSADEHTEHGPDGVTPLLSEYVWIGWIIIFTCVAVQTPIYQFYPAISASAKPPISPAMAGLPLFLRMFIQAAVGYSALRFRHLLYRLKPILILQLGAAAVLVLLWRFPGYAVSAIGISALGIWSGFGYFCAVYYAGNAGRRARNIGINEFLVGLGSIASLFVCDLFMNRPGASAEVMYAVCAAILLLASAAQWGALAIPRRRERKLQNPQ